MNSERGWLDLDSLAAQIGEHWPEGLSSIQTVIRTVNDPFRSRCSLGGSSLDFNLDTFHRMSVLDEREERSSFQFRRLCYY